MVLPDIATDNAIHTFIYSLEPYMRGFVRAQAQVIIDESLDKVLTVSLKLEEIFSIVPKYKNPSIPSRSFHHEDRCII